MNYWIPRQENFEWNLAKPYGSKFSDLNPVTGINLSLIIPTYNQRVMDVEMGTFTPLVFGTNGGMGLDCQNFLDLSQISFWLRTINPTPALFPGFEYSSHLQY